MVRLPILFLFPLLLNLAPSLVWAQESLPSIQEEQPYQQGFVKRSENLPITLLFTSDLGGRFLNKSCSELEKQKGNEDSDFLSLAKIISFAKPKQGSSLVIAGGGMLGAGSLSRFFLSSDSGARAAARLFRDAGIDVLSPGVPEFAFAKETTLAYLDEFKKIRSAAIVSNLSCNKSALCPLTQPGLLVHFGETTLGMVSFLAENTKIRVGPGHLHGADVKTWMDVIPQLQEMRKKTDFLIAEFEANSTFTLWDAISFIRVLEAKQVHIDLVHISRLDDGRGGIETVKLNNGTFIIGTPASGKGVTQVLLTKKENGSRFEIQTTYLTQSSLVESKSQQENVQEIDFSLQSLEKVLAQNHQQMCKTWGESIAELPIQGLEQEKMVQLILDAMRIKSQGEISIVNTGALHYQNTMIKKATIDSIGSFIPFKARVISGMVLGQKLQDSLEKYFPVTKDSKLAIVGMSKKDGKFMINGRELVVTSKYRVTTIDFLTSGGNHLLPTPFLEEPQVVISEDLLGLVLSFMKERQTSNLWMKPLFLENKPLWTFGFDIGTDIQSVTVSNPNRVYDRPLLSRTPSLAYRAEGNARIEMDHPKHFFQFLMKAQYGQSWLYTASNLAMPDQKSWIAEDTANLISALSLYSYKGFNHRSAYIPAPYASVGIESEFRRPETRSYTHMELSAAAGVRSLIPGQIRANAGIGVRSELLADPNSTSETEKALSRGRFLVTVGLELPKRVLWPRFGDALLGEFLINYHYTDPSVLQTHEFRATGKAYLAIKRPLYLTVGADLYLFQSQNQDPGISVDATAGLKVIMDARKQIF